MLEELRETGFDRVAAHRQDAASGLKKVGIVKDTHGLITLQRLGEFRRWTGFNR